MILTAIKPTYCHRGEKKVQVIKYGDLGTPVKAMIIEEIDKFQHKSVY